MRLRRWLRLPVRLRLLLRLAVGLLLLRLLLWHRPLLWALLLLLLLLLHLHPLQLFQQLLRRFGLILTVFLLSTWLLVGLRLGGIRLFGRQLFSSGLVRLFLIFGRCLLHFRLFRHCLRLFHRLRLRRSVISLGCASFAAAARFLAHDHRLQIAWIFRPAQQHIVVGRPVKQACQHLARRRWP